MLGSQLPGGHVRERLREDGSHGHGPPVKKTSKAALRVLVPLKKYRKALRTTNRQERLNEETRRRERVIPSSLMSILPTDS